MGCCQGEMEKKIEVSLVGKDKIALEEDYDVKYVAPDQRRETDVNFLFLIKIVKTNKSRLY